VIKFSDINSDNHTNVEKKININEFEKLKITSKIITLKKGLKIIRPLAR